MFYINFKFIINKELYGILIRVRSLICGRSIGKRLLEILLDTFSQFFHLFLISCLHLILHVLLEDKLHLFGLFGYVLVCEASLE